MKIVVVKDYEELSKRAGEMIVKEVCENPEITLGLATGSTPIGTYKEMIRHYKEGKVDYSKVKTFNLDEYIGIEKDHEASYNYYMKDNLFNHINIDMTNVHIPDGKASNMEKQCKEYDRKIEDAGGIGIQLLGIGSNGHIGFNEPGDELSAGTCIVELSDSTIKDNEKHFSDKEEVPRSAITLGMAGILKADKIIMIINGVNKHETVKNLLDKDVITTKLPASLLRLHKDATIIIDEEAYYGK